MLLILLMVYLLRRTIHAGASSIDECVRQSGYERAMLNIRSQPLKGISIAGAGVIVNGREVFVVSDLIALEHASILIVKKGSNNSTRVRDASILTKGREYP